MTEIDYALAYQFIDPAHPQRVHRLSFDTDAVPYGDPAVTNPTGHVVAVVVNFGQPDNYAKYRISYQHIRFNDADAAVYGDHLPWLEPDRTVNLAAIRERLRAAGLA